MVMKTFDERIDTQAPSNCFLFLCPLGCNRFVSSLVTLRGRHILLPESHQHVFCITPLLQHILYYHDLYCATIQIIPAIIMPSSHRSRRKSDSSNSNSSSATDSSHSARSTVSQNTYSTNTTTYSTKARPVIKHYDTCPGRYEDVTYNVFTNDEGYDPRSSVETYASTIASQDDLADQPEYQLPDERYRVYDSDARPTSSPEFARLFPTTDRILIQHDDSTSDGNMNLRLDAEVFSNGTKIKMTLFHLRMKNLHERQFSLRRHCRDSGREVCHSNKKYAKPPPRGQPQKKPTMSRAWTSYIGRKTGGARRSRDSGYQSDEEDDQELEEELRNFTMNSEVKATIPTNIIRLEYSNYAQVEIHKRRQSDIRKYDFEYWGEPYTWQRQQQVDEDDGEIIYFYELINLRTDDCVAYIMPDKLDAVQSRLEERQGGWVPPCSMRLTNASVSDDLGDVIVATGLIALTDDCIKRRWHNSRSTRIHCANENSNDFVEPEQVVDKVFPRKGAKAAGPK